MFRTGNPTLKNNAFQPAQDWDDLDYTNDRGADAAASAARKSGAANHMTIQGAVNKTAFLISLCAAAAFLCWNVGLQQVEGFSAASGEVVSGYQMSGLGLALTFGGMLLGFVIMLVTAFKPQISTFTAPVFAGCEGLFVGGISAVYAANFATEAGMLNTALVFNAVVLTFGILAGLLAAYSFKLIRPNKTFYNIVTTATLGVALYGLVALGSGFVMGFGNSPLVSVYDPNNGGLLSIGFSLFLVVLASANLVLDFDLIANGARNRAPKYMEWFGGMALLVTLVWLYIELLRLLAKLQSRD